MIYVLANVTGNTELTVWGGVFGIPVACAVAFYILVYRYYRNTDKNYNYEKETSVHISNLKTSDTKIGTNNGTKNKYIKGRNSNTPRVRVKRIKLS